MQDVPRIPLSPVAAPLFVLNDADTGVDIEQKHLVMSTHPADSSPDNTVYSDHTRPGKYRKSMIKDGILSMKIPLLNILYIQAEHVYVRIHLRNRQSILHRSSLTKVWEELQCRYFLRVHRSYVVNLRAVTYFTSSYVMIGKKKIAIGRAFRAEAIAVLSRWGDEE
ncbi:hypothetical protein CEQ90_13675 [Lewinellaceae bacterium SD302]|nr:hypothetical protein CEQ90_13675 [Lewinellaceae bacterium SD302]